MCRCLFLCWSAIKREVFRYNIKISLNHPRFSALSSLFLIVNFSWCANPPPSPPPNGDGIICECSLTFCKLTLFELTTGAAWILSIGDALPSRVHPSRYSSQCTENPLTVMLWMACLYWSNIWEIDKDYKLHYIQIPCIFLQAVTGAADAVTSSPNAPSCLPLRLWFRLPSQVDHNFKKPSNAVSCRNSDELDFREQYSSSWLQSNYSTRAP